MLFTMTVPFLEVVLHTTNELFKESTICHVGPHNSVGVVRVKPDRELEMEEEKECQRRCTWLGIASRLMLPICSIVFIFTFWTVGIITSFTSDAALDPSMTDCLIIDLN